MKLKWHLIFLFFLFIIGFATATVQRTKETLVKESFQVDPSNYEAFEFRFDLQSMIGTRLAGSFLAQGNNSKDIEVYVMDEYALINWKNGFQAKSIFDSGRVSAGVFETAMDKDHFYVIVDNSFSDSVKNVSLRLDATFDKAFLGLSYYSIFVLGALIFMGAFYGITIFYGTKTKTETRDWLIPAIILILLVGFSWFFNPNALTLITGLVSLVVAVSTFENIRLTRKTVEEMKATRISQTRPHVIVDLELENFLMFLALRNIGNGVARDVVLDFDPSLGNSQGMVVSEMPYSRKLTTLHQTKKSELYLTRGSHILVLLQNCLGYSMFHCPMWMMRKKRNMKKS